MREIISQQLWLGHAIDIRDVRRLHNAGVKAVVDLAYEEPFAQLSRDMLYCRFPLNDGADNPPELLATAITTTSSLIRKHIPTIVACSAGMSRSPCITAAALAAIRGTSPDECLQELIEGQPHDISPRLWQDIRKAYNVVVSS